LFPGSARSVNGRLNFLANLAWDRELSGLTPRMIAPAVA